MTLQRAAFASLLALSLLVGLGDVSPESPLSAIRWLLPLALALTCLGVVAMRKRPDIPPSVAWPVGVWVGVQAASALAAARHQPEALSALERPVSGALLAAAVFLVCDTPFRAGRLAMAIGAGGIGIAALGLLQASGNVAVGDWLASQHGGSVPIGDVPRLASTLSHPNLAAILLELSLPLVVAWTWTAGPRARWPVAIASLACLLALVLTFSRTGMIAAVLALGLMGFYARRRAAGWLLAMLLIVPLALAWAAVADPGLDRRLSAGLDESSPLSPSRLEYWSVAWRMALDHPWLGVGLDNYRWEFAAYTGIGIDNLGVHAHDEWLDALANTGVLGLVAQVVLFAALLRCALWRLTRTAAGRFAWRVALLGSLGAWLLHGLLDDFDHFWPASVLFWLVAGLTVRFARFEAPQEAQQALGRLALRDELDAGAQRLEPVFGSTAQRDYAAGRADATQSLEVARRQSR